MSYDIAEIVIQQMKPHTIAQFFTCVLRDDEVNRDKAKRKKKKKSPKFRRLTTQFKEG